MKKETFRVLGLPDTTLNKKRWTYLLGLFIILFLLGGCGGTSSTDDGDNGNQGDGNLNITVMDDPLTEQPLENAYVSLYNADNKTILKTIKTGSDGVASFH